MSEWLSVVKLFSNHILLLHDLCANMQKIVEQIFAILILNFLANFKT